jgi:hypothetical protein
VLQFLLHTCFLSSSKRAIEITCAHKVWCLAQSRCPGKFAQNIPKSFTNIIKNAITHQNTTK